MKQTCNSADGTVNERKIFRAGFSKMILLAFLTFFATQTSQAQYYDNAIGIRAGVASGISFKHFISNNDAIELIASFHHQSLQLGALYQRHAGAFDIQGMNWYYGGGGFLGFYDGRYHPSWGTEGRHTVLGVMGVLGLEYKIDEIPVSVGIDFTPAIDIAPITHTWFGYNVVLRYVF